jgi:hypothetical protein
MSATSPLRDSRLGRRLKLTGGKRMIVQAERGGTTRDNVIRIQKWRERYDEIPLEIKIAPVGYVPIPRYLSLVPIY